MSLCILISWNLRSQVLARNSRPIQSAHELGVDIAAIFIDVGAMSRPYALALARVAPSITRLAAVVHCCAVIRTVG